MFSAELISQELKIVFDFIHQSGTKVIAVLDNPARRTGVDLQLECATAKLANVELSLTMLKNIEF